jgi:metal-responsive CopG/Arc/MetJ family transcriptional regulator
MDVETTETTETGLPSVTKPTFSLRLPKDLLAELDRLVDVLNARATFGKASRTELIEACIRAHLPTLRAEIEGTTDTDK